VELACRHAARLVPLLWATCAASEFLAGRLFHPVPEPRHEVNGDSFFVLLGFDAIYPRTMQKNSLNPLAWIVVGRCRLTPGFHS